MNKDSLELSVIKNTILEAKALGTKGISFTGGGEPMIHKNYLEILEFEAFVSCGTFIRSLCYNIGKLLNLDTCAYRINRIKVGEYTL